MYGLQTNCHVPELPTEVGTPVAAAPLCADIRSYGRVLLGHIFLSQNFFTLTSRCKGESEVVLLQKVVNMKLGVG